MPPAPSGPYSYLLLSVYLYCGVLTATRSPKNQKQVVILPLPPSPVSLTQLLPPHISHQLKSWSSTLPGTVSKGSKFNLLFSAISCPMSASSVDLPSKQLSSLPLYFLTPITASIYTWGRAADRGVSEPNSPCLLTF